MAITISEVRQFVGAYYGVPRSVMNSESRGRGVSRPRQMAMVLAREFTGASYPRIGAQFGGRDHTTVMHAIKTIKLREAYSKEFRETMGQLRIALAHHVILGPQTFKAPCVTPQTFTARQVAP